MIYIHTQIGSITSLSLALWPIYVVLHDSQQTQWHITISAKATKCKKGRKRQRAVTGPAVNQSLFPVWVAKEGRENREGGKRDRWLEVVRWQRDFTKRSWRQQVWKVSCIMLFKSRPTPTLGSAIRELTRTHARRKDIKCVQSKHPNSKNKAFTFSEENSGCLPMQNSSSWLLG